MICMNSFDPQCITIGQMNMIAGRLYMEGLYFGDIMQIAFGREASNTFSQLMNQSAVLFRDLISSHLAGDREATAENIDRLYRNADRTAAFLASINPFWNEAEWERRFRTFVQYLLEEINLYTAGEFSLGIEAFDRIKAFTGEMGEAFAQGLYEYITMGLQCEKVEPQKDHCYTLEQVNAIYDIRMFWFELVTWIRRYMFSRYFEIFDAEEVSARLRQVPSDYVSRLIEVFGPSPYADALLNELNIYLDLLDQLITAQMENRPDEISRITRLLYQNAAERARLISTINPFYSEAEWKRRLDSNLSDTFQLSNAFLTGDFSKNLDVYSTLLAEAESASGYFTRGIIDYINGQRNKATNSAAVRLPFPAAHPCRHPRNLPPQHRV